MKKCKRSDGIYTERGVKNESTCFLKYSCEKIFYLGKSLIFCAPTKSQKYSHFCFITKSEENGSRGCCDVYPGRLNILCPLISLRLMQYILEKCTETPSTIFNRRMEASVLVVITSQNEGCNTYFTLINM